MKRSPGVVSVTSSALRGPCLLSGSASHPAVYIQQARVIIGICYSTWQPSPSWARGSHTTVPIGLYMEILESSSRGPRTEKVGRGEGRVSGSVPAFHGDDNIYHRRGGRGDRSSGTESMKTCGCERREECFGGSLRCSQGCWAGRGQ